MPGNVATPLRTLGSSIMRVAEWLAGAGREPEPGSVLEKRSSVIRSNRKTKMWPFLLKRPLCNRPWGLAFLRPQFPDLPDECFGWGDPSNSFQLWSPVTETKVFSWLLIPVLGQPQDLWPDMRSVCRFQDKWGLSPCSWCPFPVSRILLLCFVRPAVITSMASPALTAFHPQGSWSIPGTWPGGRWHSRSGRVGGSYRELAGHCGHPDGPWLDGQAPVFFSYTHICSLQPIDFGMSQTWLWILFLPLTSCRHVA